MAHFSTETGDIILSEEDKMIFKECGVNAMTNKTPTANKIIKWIMGENKDYEIQNKLVGEETR